MQRQQKTRLCVWLGRLWHSNVLYVGIWLLLADGYNLLMGICSVPLSTSHTNMSRSVQAVQKVQSDLEINLFFLAV